MKGVGHETVALQTLLASGLVDTTRLVERLGDESASHLFRRHDRMARDLMENHEGREIDKRDGFLILFERPINAARYALDYIKGLSDISSDLIARVGIHFGEVRFWVNSPDDVARGAKPYEVEGMTKSTAIRMMKLARNNQVLMTRGAFDLARRSVTGNLGEALVWLAHGSFLFKDTETPLEVYEIGIKDLSPLMRPEDTEEQWREQTGGDILGWRAAPDLEMPRRPHWILIRKLMDNDFGEVWLCNHAKTHDRRIFKFCYHKDGLRALKSEIALFRLLKEGLGNRPDINRVIDWNFDDAPFYIESEYSEAGSLKEWINQRGGFEKVPLQERIDLVIQIATALGAAHSVGVLHKNLRPETVMVSAREDGSPQAQLADFGVSFTPSKAQADKQSTSMSGLGISDIISVARMDASRANWLYMAPELGEGRLDTIQADVFALGVLLYQMVLGDFHRFLVPGWEVEIGDSVIREDISSMVMANPADRIASAQDVALRLSNLEKRRSERTSRRTELDLLKEELAQREEDKQDARQAAARAAEQVQALKSRLDCWVLPAVSWPCWHSVAFSSGNQYYHASA